MPISFEILQSSWWFRCIFILAVLYGLCSPFVMQWAQCRETRGQLQGGQWNIGWDKSKLWKPCLNMPYFILGYHSQTYIFKNRLPFSQADNSNFLTFLSFIILFLLWYCRNVFFLNCHFHYLLLAKLFIPFEFSFIVLNSLRVAT